MRCGRQALLRQHAIYIANCSNASERIDWPLFNRTGAFKKRKPLPRDPLVKDFMDRITANDGKLVI